MAPSASAKTAASAPSAGLPHTLRHVTDTLWRCSGADIFPSFLGYLKDNSNESFKRRGYFLKARLAHDRIMHVFSA